MGAGSEQGLEEGARVAVVDELARQRLHVARLQQRRRQPRQHARERRRLLIALLPRLRCHLRCEAPRRLVSAAALITPLRIRLGSYLISLQAQDSIRRGSQRARSLLRHLEMAMHGASL